MDKTINSVAHRRLIALLRKYREDAGLRQTAVADALDEPQSFVSKYESGERRLDLVELRHVCAALGVSLVDLVTAFEHEAGDA